MLGQVGLLSGIRANGQSEFRDSFPTNLEPIAFDNKLSNGQLRAAAGATSFSAGPGLDRGSIVWNNVQYRVMGTKLVTVAEDGTVATLGDVGGEGKAGLDYGPDRLRIRSSGNLFYWDGSTLDQVTDTDLGTVKDMIWVGGYTMTTDGTYIIVTELSDPTSVQPLKYGTAEVDPDPVTGLFYVESAAEVHVLGQNTIQPFRNVGGNGFPFSPILQAVIPYGCVGPDAKTRFSTTYAFVGSARNEGLRVFVAGQADAQPISSTIVEEAINAVADPSSIVMETRTWRGEQRILIHLPEETWVFCAEASAKVQKPVWYKAKSGRDNPYRLRNAVMFNGKTYVGDTDSSAIGILTDDVISHFGDVTGWQFDVGLMDGPGCLNSIELVSLPGRGPSGEQSRIWLSLSRDGGETFGMERDINTGVAGERRKRIQWRPHARYPRYLACRFRGYDNFMPGFARCDADIERLND